MKKILSSLLALILVCNLSAQISPIPSSNLKMWLRGDDGITKDGNGKVSFRFG